MVGFFPLRVAKPRVGEKNFPMSHERYIPIPVQVTSFPHEWLSRRGEKNSTTSGNSRRGENSTMSGEATSGGILTTTAIATSAGFFSPQLLSHKWGKLVTRTGIGMYLE